MVHIFSNPWHLSFNCTGSSYVWFMSCAQGASGVLAHFLFPLSEVAALRGRRTMLMVCVWLQFGCSLRYDGLLGSSLERYSFGLFKK